MTRISGSAISSGDALADWVVEAALAGASPLSRAEDLAREYLLDQSFVTDDQRADCLVREETSRRFTTGFLSGFGGVLTPPGQAPRAVVAGWVVAARMAGAVARVFRHDLDSESARALVLVCLAPDAAESLVREAGASPPDTALQDLVDGIPGQRLTALRSAAIEHLLQVAGHPKGTRDMLVPGHSADELVDATWCFAVGRTAIALFRRFTVGDRTACGSLKLSNWEAAG